MSATSMINELFMPAIATDNLPSETASHIRQAYRDVQEGPAVGIIEERYHGSLPIHEDRDPPYEGVTEFMPRLSHNGLEPEAVRMGISDRLPTYITLPNGKVINYKKRVGRHESRHVRSESLLKYMDVGERTATLIMESYAEFGDIKANPSAKDEVILTTPYTPAIKFGLYAEKFYKSDIDGANGYAAFIRDIQKCGSARMALDNLGRNIKSAVDKGINPIGVVESSFKQSVREALMKGSSNGYVN